MYLEKIKNIILYIILGVISLVLGLGIAGIYMLLLFGNPLLVIILFIFYLYLIAILTYCHYRGIDVGCINFSYISSKVKSYIKVFDEKIDRVINKWDDKTTELFDKLEKR